MSLFQNQESVYDVFLGVDDNVGKKFNYDLNTPDFQVDANIIRINDSDSIIEGQELGDYRANVSGPNSSLISEGSILRSKIGQQLIYKVVNKPRYNKLFDRYKLNLKPS